MAYRAKVSSAAGLVPGRYHEETLVCQYVHMVNSMGCSWFGCEPFAFSLPVLLAQFALFSLLTRTLYFFLKPLKQSMISAQLIAGIIIRQSFQTQNKTNIMKLFPPGGRLILETIADVGFMLHLFIIGVQIDATLVKKAGRNAVLIGTTGFILPYALGALAVFTLPNLIIIDDSIHRSLPLLAAINSMSMFAVITNHLADLNILNSELGRLASSTSMICDICNYFATMVMLTVGVSIRYSQLRPLWNILWAVTFVVLIMFVLRPVILQIAKQIPEGQPMKEIHFLGILVVVLVSGFCSEALGQSAGFGTFILGITVPDGPPLGAALVHKLDTLSTGIFLPAKIVIGGLNVDLFSIGKGSSGVIIEIVIILGYVGKFSGTVIAAIYHSVAFWDAVSLGLVMCCKGVIEVAAYLVLKDNGMLDDKEYALLLLSMLIITGIARPLISHFYDPSKRYFAYTRKCILHTPPNTELRMLVCIHNDDNIPTILNLLEASNPTRYRPISVYVLNLMELTGRAAAILVPNFRPPKLTSIPSRTKHIINVFNHFAQHNTGCVKVQHFTAVSPYASMHDDVCTIALDKSATIVIVPFHKQWAFDGTVDATFPSIRAVNKNIIEKAPCSVGILIDRGQIGGSQNVWTTQSSFKIATLFLGGADDREALAYSIRMAEHPHITVALVWLRPWGYHKIEAKTIEDELDCDLINQFRVNTMGNKRANYKEEMVNDGVGTTRVLRSMEDNCDLFIVGRNHDAESPLLLGLTEWSECPELGVIGDMLATSDFRFSVLVVQQQPPGHDFQEMGYRRVGDSRVYGDLSENQDSRKGHIR